LLYLSNRYKDIYHFEKAEKENEEGTIKRIEAASLLFDIIKNGNIPFKRTINKLPGWEVSLL
jgi:hypothetical protein